MSWRRVHDLAGDPLATAAAAVMQNALGDDDLAVPASTWLAFCRAASLCAGWILAVLFGSRRSSLIEARSTFLLLVALSLLPVLLGEHTSPPRQRPHAPTPAG
jgi:hypothetical protein